MRSVDTKETRHSEEICDAVVVGEGEEDISKLLEVFKNDTDFRTVDGVAFDDGNGLVVTSRRKPMTDLDAPPFAAPDLLPMGRYFNVCPKEKVFQT